MKWNLVVRNVAALVDPPKVVKREVTPLDPQQARTLLEHCESHRPGALFTTALAVGLRLGEMLALRWKGVDLDNGLVHIPQTLQKVDGKTVVAEPKSAKSRRSLALPDVAVSALRAHGVTQLEDRMLAGSRADRTRDTLTKRSSR